MKVYKAPQIVPEEWEKTHVFLAGSIEMGAAEDWQDRVTHELKDYDNVILLNPRRDDWDSSWKQEKTNPQFAEQVNWELNNLESSDVIFMYFDPATKSPISLLELGLYVGTHNMIVCCPNAFWRKGNVDIVCERLSVDVYDNLDDAIEILKRILK